MANLTWSVIKRDAVDAMFTKLQNLAEDEVIVVTSNGHKNLERLRSMLIQRAKHRGLTIQTRKISNDHMEIVLD